MNESISLMSAFLLKAGSIYIGVKRIDRGKNAGDWPPHFNDLVNYWQFG